MEIGDRVVPQEKALRMLRGFEALHNPFASPCRQVRTLRPIVQGLLLMMFERHAHAVAGRAIRIKLVGDHHARRAGLLTNEFAR